MPESFGWYAGSYRVETVDSKDPLVQLEASKSNIKDSFKDFLDKINGFKYQIIVKFLLRKRKRNGDVEFAPTYFNSTTKTVVNFKYMLDKLFQEVFYRIDNWINNDCGWVIESVNAEYLNISIYSPLSGSTYIKLPCKSRNLVSHETFKSTKNTS